MLRTKFDYAKLKSFAQTLKEFPHQITRKEAEAVGKEIIAEMKDMISKGESTIAGAGRFPGYKHAGVKGKYPDSVRYKYPSKRQRPVNLSLSGDFLRALRHRIYAAKFGFGIEVGYFDPEEAKKEEGHASGWNGQPKRPTIPAKGEEIAVRIQRLVIARFKETFSAYVKKK